MSNLVEAAIAITGPTAIWLSQSRSPQFQRWACIVGLAAQPFFAMSLWDSPQWGLQVVAIVSATGWVKGFWTHWLAPRWQPPKAADNRPK